MKKLFSLSLSKAICAFALCAFALKSLAGTNAAVTLNTNTGQLLGTWFSTGGPGLILTNTNTGAGISTGTNFHLHFKDEYGTTYDFHTNGTLDIENTNGNHVTLTNGNIIFSGTITGNGSGLTGISGGSSSFNPGQFNTNGSSQVTATNIAASIVTGTLSINTTGAAATATNAQTSTTALTASNVISAIIITNATMLGALGTNLGEMVWGTNTPIWSAAGNIYEPSWINIYSGSNSPGFNALTAFGDFRSGTNGERYAVVINGESVVTTGYMEINGDGGAEIGIPDFGSSMLNIADDVAHGVVQGSRQGYSVPVYQLFAGVSGGNPTDANYTNGMQTAQIDGAGQLTLNQQLWGGTGGDIIRIILAESQKNVISGTGKTNAFGIDVYNGKFQIGFLTGSGINTNGTNWTGTNAVMSTAYMTIDTAGNLVLGDRAPTMNIGGDSTSIGTGNIQIYDNIGSLPGAGLDIQANGANMITGEDLDGVTQFSIDDEGDILTSGFLDLGGPLTVTNTATISGAETVGGGITIQSNKAIEFTVLGANTNAYISAGTTSGAIHIYGSPSNQYTFEIDAPTNTILSTNVGTMRLKGTNGTWLDAIDGMGGLNIGATNPIGQGSVNIVSNLTVGTTMTAGTIIASTIGTTGDYHVGNAGGLTNLPPVILATNVPTGINITNPTIVGATISGNGVGLTNIQTPISISFDFTPNAGTNYYVCSSGAAASASFGPPTGILIASNMSGICEGITVLMYGSSASAQSATVTIYTNGVASSQQITASPYTNAAPWRVWSDFSHPFNYTNGMTITPVINENLSDTISGTVTLVLTQTNGVMP